MYANCIKEIYSAMLSLFWTNWFCVKSTSSNISYNPKAVLINNNFMAYLGNKWTVVRIFSDKNSPNISFLK